MINYLLSTLMLAGIQVVAYEVLQVELMDRGMVLPLRKSGYGEYLLRLVEMGDAG